MAEVEVEVDYWINGEFFGWPELSENRLDILAKDKGSFKGEYLVSL